MSASSELEDQVIAAAERLGWVIQDLNDNKFGAQVRGQNWKAELITEMTIYGWTRGEVAEELARWILRLDLQP